MEAKIADTQNSWHVVLFVIFTRKTLPFKASLETYVGWVERSETHHFAPAAVNYLAFLLFSHSRGLLELCKLSPELPIRLGLFHQSPTNINSSPCRPPGHSGHKNHPITKKASSGKRWLRWLLSWSNSSRLISTLLCTKAMAP